MCEGLALFADGVDLAQVRHAVEWGVTFDRVEVEDVSLRFLERARQASPQEAQQVPPPQPAVDRQPVQEQLPCRAPRLDSDPEGLNFGQD